MGAMRTTPPTGTLSPPASHPTPRKKRVARKLRETSLEVWAWEEIGTPCLHLCMQKTRTAQDLQGNTKPAPPQILRTAQHSAHSGSTQKTRQMYWPWQSSQAWKVEIRKIGPILKNEDVSKKPWKNSFFLKIIRVPKFKLQKRKFSIEKPRAAAEF